MTEADRILENLLEEAGTLKNKLKDEENRLEVLKSNIINIHSDSCKTLNKPEENTIESKGFSATVCKRMKIKYDYDKLKETLDSEDFKKVISKNYSLNDVKGFLDLLKEYGVPVKEVKKHIISTPYVDETKLQKAFDEEIFSLTDIKDCYEATLTRYLKISDKKKK